MTYKVVFVDLGGVLIINKAREVGEKYDKEFGLTKEITQDIFHFLHSQERTDQELADYLKSKGVEATLWANFTKDFYNSEKRNDELFEKLREMRRDGAKVIITTNNGTAARKVIDKYGVGEIVDGFVSSAEIGFTKPQKEYWQAAVDEARKLIPDIINKEILVIDDSHENCVSAIQFGFDAIEYTK